MSWNPFKRRDQKDAEAMEHDADFPALRMGDDEDPTDPLISAAAYREEENSLREWPGVQLSEVRVGSAADLQASFIKLVVEQQGLLSSSLPGLLMEGGAVMGLRDLLAGDSWALAAALEPCTMGLGEFSVALSDGRLSPRPLDLLLAMRDLAVAIDLAGSKGLALPAAPESLALELQPGLTSALDRWQLRFIGFGDLVEGQAARASVVSGLLRPLLEQVLSGCSLLPRDAFVLPLQRFMDDCAARESLSCTEFAALIERRIAGLRLQGDGLTDNGVRRQHNEDAWLLAEVHQQAAVGSRLAIAAVADGMGGHESGEIASSLSLAMLRQQLQHVLTAPSTRAIDTSALAKQLGVLIPGINRALVERSAMDESLRGMGTTLCGFTRLQSDSTLHEDRSSSSAFFNVGDSRCYIVGPSSLTRVTRDHSFVQELVDSGEVPEEQAFDHPRKNVITRCLGGDGLEIEADIYTYSVGPCERLLICSDGLSDALRDPEIRQVISDNSGASRMELAQALVDAANAAGGPDNITVLLLDCLF